METTVLRRLESANKIKKAPSLVGMVLCDPGRVTQLNLRYRLCRNRLILLLSNQIDEKHRNLFFPMTKVMQNRLPRVFERDETLSRSSCHCSRPCNCKKRSLECMPLSKKQVHHSNHSH